MPTIATRSRMPLLAMSHASRPLAAIRASDAPATEQQRLRVRVRNAMILLDLQNCDAGYTPTEFQRRCFPPEYQAKIRTIYDGVDTSVYRRLRRSGRVFGRRVISRHTRIVTYCASAFERVRGFDIFMQAARIIYRRHPDVVFLVVGSDRETKFVFLGLVPPTVLARVLSAGDAHIYLTVPFVLGWSLMDALACGAVVIGSDTEPVREMISSGDNGFLVDFFDPKRSPSKRCRSCARRPRSSRSATARSTSSASATASTPSCRRSPRSMLRSRAAAARWPEPGSGREHTPLDVTAVPAPGPLLLIIVGVGGALIVRRRQRTDLRD